MLELGRQGTEFGLCGGFPKIRGTIIGSPYTKLSIIVFWSLYSIGVPYFGETAMQVLFLGIFRSRAGGAPEGLDMLQSSSGCSDLVHSLIVPLK